MVSSVTSPSSERNMNNDESNNSVPTSQNNFEFITPTPIDKPNDTGERGTGYNYECDRILDGFDIPTYKGLLSIEAPFSYQVAGHDPFLKVFNGLICKPYVPREVWFYLQLENYPHYKQFVADFLGTVEFTTAEILEFTTSALTSDEQNNLTPWAEKVHQGHVQRINSSAKYQSSPLHRYIVLRDMTFNCVKPCVMDLKLGTRAYGDDATEKKKISQTIKSKRTTSYKTGLRICGVQGYSVEKGEFWRMHKYEGRKITKDTMPLALHKFFHNDNEIRIDVVQQFIKKCREIEETIKRKEFRLYSTSLLLVYDGIPPIESHEPTVHLTMIDFAHTFATNGKPVDDGYLFGIQNLIGLLESLLSGDITDITTNTDTSAPPPSVCDDATSTTAS